MREPVKYYNQFKGELKSITHESWIRNAKIFLERDAKLVNIHKASQLYSARYNLHLSEQDLFTLLSVFYNLTSIFRAEKCLVKDSKRQNLGGYTIQFAH